MSVRRGTCPTLSAPMQTGDGLLARLNPVEGRLRAGQLAGLARAAERFGNGIIEITARGSLQVRGLTAESAAELGAEVDALGIEARSDLPLDIGPLAGLDAEEIADPRRLAREIRAKAETLGLVARLGPKVSVTVDGGGVLGLGGLLADVKLEAVDAENWLLRIGGISATARVLGQFGEEEAADVSVRVLAAIAERGSAARARDLVDAELAAITGGKPLPADGPQTPPRSPVGLFSLGEGRRARGFALAYGQIASQELIAFAEALEDDRKIRLARGRGLILLDVRDDEEAALVAAARRLGLVTDTSDPRLSIAVCAGRPACASAHLATRHLADRLAKEKPGLLDNSFTLHISGCEKQCARPSGPAVTLIGSKSVHEIRADGALLPPDLKAALSALAEENLEPNR